LVYTGLPTGWGGVADGDETLQRVSGCRVASSAAALRGSHWCWFRVGRLRSVGRVVRDLLPVLQKFGIATTEDIRIETLAARLREEVTSAGGVARLPALVSAWTRIGDS